MFKCNAFPLLNTYEKARAHYERVKPITRGQHKGAKPIHLRSRPMERIMRDGDDVVYVCAYDNPEQLPEWGAYVRWKPDGEIHVSIPMYNCVYEILSSLLGLNFYRQDNALWVQTYQTFRLRDRGAGVRGNPEKDTTPNIFKMDTTGYLQLMNPERRTRLLLDRKRANNVRSRYKAFRDYLSATLKLREGVFSLQEMVDMFGADKALFSYGWYSFRHVPNLEVKRRYNQTPNVSWFMELIGSDDPEDFYRASLMMVKTFGETSWMRVQMALSGNGSDCRILPESVAMRALDDVLFYTHKDEVFRQEILEAFDTAKDIYAWVRD